MRLHEKFKAVKTLDSEVLLTLMEIPVKERERLFCTIANTVTALDQFEIQARPNKDASYVTIKSAAGDYTTPTGSLVDASGDLTALGASATGWFTLNVLGYESVRIQIARAAGSNAVVTLQGGATG